MTPEISKIPTKMKATTADPMAGVKCLRSMLFNWEEQSVRGGSDWGKTTTQRDGDDCPPRLHEEGDSLTGTHFVFRLLPFINAESRTYDSEVEGGQVDDLPGGRPIQSPDQSGDGYDADQDATLHLWSGGWIGSRDE